MELTPKQEKFARLVAEGKTYADAYRASYSVAKASNNSIWVQSSKLMENSKVSIRVEEIREEMLAESKVTLEQILEEMKNWVLFDPLEMFNPDDTVKSMTEMPPEVRKSIVSFEVVELFENIDKEKVQVGELKKVKLVDKRAVSDQFMKHFGAYLTKIEVSTDKLDHLEEILKGIKE